MLDTLYKTDSKDKTRVWKIWTEGADIVTEHGLEDGERQISRKAATPKNVGKTNETTAPEQASLEAKSMWEKKQKKGYNKVKGAKPERPLPMLAQDFTKSGHRIVYPCITQPKIDGLRCLAKLNNSGEVELYSREGNIFPVDLNTIKDELKPILVTLGKNTVLDGELFDGTIPFEQLVGIIKRASSSEKEREGIKYIIFDAFGSRFVGCGYSDRRTTLLQHIKKQRFLEIIESVECATSDTVDTFLMRFIADGHEGVMLRNTESEYKVGHRSHNLQKYKKFKDSEFKIIGAKEGIGKDSGTVIWECETGRETFEVRPRGTVEHRRQLWDDHKNYIGTFLTVRYQELTDKGIPRFPVGIEIRDYE